MAKHVKNSNRKAKFPPACGCDSYLEHWEKATNSKRPEQCSKSGCTKPAEVGAHVINCSVTANNSLKIVPLCKPCNNPANKECFPLVKGTKTPSAGKLLTC